MSRQAPDLFTLGSQLPDLEELMPEELKYLRDICRLLKDLELPGTPMRAETRAPSEDDALFDRDELGIDPEDDYEEYA